MPVIQTQKCNGCGLCLAVCKCGGLVISENVAKTIETEACDWCLECEVVCPTGAITCPYEIIIQK